MAIIIIKISRIITTTIIIAATNVYGALINAGTVLSTLRVFSNLILNTILWKRY